MSAMDLWRAFPGKPEKAGCSSDGVDGGEQAVGCARAGGRRWPGRV